MTELKPCPFCGNRFVKIMTLAECECRDTPTDYEKTHYGVVCDYQIDGCGAATGWQYNSETEAAEAWNRRAENGRDKRYDIN